LCKNKTKQIKQTRQPKNPKNKFNEKAKELYNENYIYERNSEDCKKWKSILCS
jgi:hypothetical protein